MRYQWEGSTKPGKQRMILVFLGICALTILGILAGLEFRSKHFRANTFVQDINCSYLTVEEATTKIKETIEQQEITFNFINDVQYQTDGKQLGLNIESELEEITSELQRFLESQKSNKKQEEYHYFLENFIRADKEKIRLYFSTIVELQKANMVKPQNAYLDWTENGLLTIVPEVYGTEIDFEEAVTFVIQSLEKGDTEVDFTSITNSIPEICSANESLQAECTIINTALQTEIQYELYDGTIFALKPERIKEWVERDEEGHYFINFEKNVISFLEELNSVARKANSKITFQPTGHETMTFSVPHLFRAKVDMDKEKDVIEENLKQGGTFSREPAYTRIFDTRNMLSYIEIDLIRQRVLMYYEGKCIVDTPCVTGSVIANNETPPGLFYLTYKTRNATLMNNSFVKYWMPFNGDIGLHDASWRSEFGEEIYKTDGSHGCVNLPEEAAKIIYEHIDTSMPIIVYA